jgi:TPR repeat protein
MKMTLTKWNRLVSRLSEKAEAGDPEAQWELGSWIEDGFINRRGVVVVPEDRRTALRWFRRSAMSGNASAQIHLGVYFSGGRCTRRDDVQALFWFKRALRQGSSIAPNNIASVYRDREDHRRVLFWYERAAAGGDGDALVEVGIQYYAEC